jgi:arsenite/tail-anchored protein-transporting ATPase
VRLIIYTGKGGTGKTVNSCSTAIALADRNYKTLILSSDPAHTLNDAFMVNHIGNEPVKVINNLYALQVDPVIEVTTHFSSILSYMASVFFSKGIDETLSYEIAMLPGMTQLFSLLCNRKRDGFAKETCDPFQDNNGLCHYLHKTNS